ncbi:T9SS type A sorting domain-containing protein [Flavobacterium suzhouense]|uniref:T9SS type A sorting domain-containing protein n=1 Tax=Flavobacterium suzhouense TaxID=1529638 RepID=A0ABW5NQA0_9FLAO
MKKLLLTSLLATGTLSLSAQTVSIPDPIFEQLLIDKEIDSDNIVNGQILITDALAVTSLSITYENLNDLDYITDLTGIEAFTNLENLDIDYTMIENLNISTLVNLKHLDCGAYNMLMTIDVSHNTLLESLYFSNGPGDVGPMNSIQDIDLSQNPNISDLRASGGVHYINLKNGNNNPNMKIIINEFENIWGGPEPSNHVCIEVDNPEAAQNNAFPYSDWDITHLYTTYSFTADCSLGTKSFPKSNALVYPNPASDVLHFQTTDGTTIDRATIYDLSGRLMKEYNNINSSISISDLQTGTYIIKLVSGKETFTQKIIKK